MGVSGWERNVGRTLLRDGERREGVKRVCGMVGNSRIAMFILEKSVSLPSSYIYFVSNYIPTSGIFKTRTWVRAKH